MSPTKLLRLLGNRGFRSALMRHRVAAAAEHRRALSQLECATVVDIGANRGQFALAVRRALPEARIISFEPLPAPAAVFRCVFARDPGVVLHEAAVGPTDGKVVMHVSARDDSSSLLPIAALQHRIFPGTAEVATQKVLSGPLSRFVAPADIDAPALLKLDVQGYELQALQACEDLLDRFAHIYAECSFVELYEHQALADEVVAWLHSRGFALASIHNPAYDSNGACVQADLLFMQLPRMRPLPAA
jgi:FkbM family methyltransferase